MPLLIEQQTDLIATAPMELANVHARDGNVRAFEQSLEWPSFVINPYSHPLFQHGPALMGWRDLIKQGCERYLDIFRG